MARIRVRLRFRHWLPALLGVEGIVLYPFVLFARERQNVGTTLIRHEMVHVRQVRERGWLGFYTRYLWEYLCLRAGGKSRGDAYRGISFEQEAYSQAESVQLSESEKEEAGLA